jgi:hypothetical protein
MGQEFHDIVRAPFKLLRGSTSAECGHVETATRPGSSRSLWSCHRGWKNRCGLCGRIWR